MLKTIVCTVLGGLLAAACLPAGSASAQQAVMDEFYGNGVHSFYDRDFFQAMQNLSVAIDGGSRDPRAHYYRGLAKMRTGDIQGARADLQRGADLESADVDQFYPVAKSLERVQGADRRELERYRAMARAQARDRQIRRDAVRYEERRRSEAQVLRSVPVGPAPAPLGVAPATAVEAVPPTPEPVAAPATPPPPASDDPFGTAPASDDPFGAAAPADAPASDDPFGGAAPADAPAEEMPADAAAEEDPFGGAGASDDPFADDPN